MKISQFYFDILGELSADSLLVKLFPEFPELAYFVLLQRLFWFPRRGFSDRPDSALINTDNDSWIGAFLWTRLERSDVLAWDGRDLRIDWSRVPSAFSEILDEIDELGREVLKSENSREQDAKVSLWMSRSVPLLEDGSFTLSPSLAEAFLSCQDIPEVPHFNPFITGSRSLS
jgi:hypothetical protein